jgi:hypothetical protein
MFTRFKGWFSALSLIGKIFVAAGISVLVLATAGAATRDQQRAEPPKPQPPTVIKTTKTETATVTVPFDTKTVDDSNLASGTTKVQTEGADGVKTQKWEVTYTNGKETSRKLTSEEITTQPVTKVIANGTKIAVVPKPASNCDPNYSGACVPNVYPSDVDCAGGSGNGPYYVQGPVHVVGTDRYGLDRDGDGIGCE